MHIQIRKRSAPLSWAASPCIFGLALLVSLGVCSLLLLAQGKPAWQGMLLFLDSGFGSSWAIIDGLNKAVPIFLCSLGVAVAFRLQIWNIGAEGQYALGAIGATWVALSFPHWPWPALIPLMFISAALFGAAWGLIPALLKTKLRTNEIIVTLMLNYIGILVLEYLVYGLWKDPASFGFPMTEQFTSAAIIGRIADTDLHWGLLVCCLAGLGLSVVLGKSRFGYELKACGDNIRAATYARIPYPVLVAAVMAISGGLAGWAGCIETSATLNRLQPSVMAGYGYTAIVVAWLAKLSPLRIALFSYLLAGLLVGVEGVQLELQVPAAFGSILEGLILLTVLCGQFFTTYTFDLHWKDA